MWYDLTSEKAGQPSLPEEVPLAESTFAELSFEDLWDESRMVSVCRWLRGGKDLEIPPSFYNLLPKRL